MTAEKKPRLTVMVGGAIALAVAATAWSYQLTQGTTLFGRWPTVGMIVIAIACIIVQVKDIRREIHTRRGRRTIQGK